MSSVSPKEDKPTHDVIEELRKQYKERQRKEAEMSMEEYWNSKFFQGNNNEVVEDER